MKRSHPTDKHVGRRLRMRRLMLKKSQSDIANALGLTFQQIQKYEKGSSRVSAGRLQGLCAALQVPVSFFFDGALQEPKLPALVSDEQSPSYVTEFLATSDGVALAVAFGRIRSPRVRRAIVALVEQIVVEPEDRVVNLRSPEPAVAASTEKSPGAFAEVGLAERGINGQDRVESPVGASESSERQT
jgi:transcriptional regulator with XRE-family HTH domain